MPMSSGRGIPWRKDLLTATPPVPARRRSGNWHIGSLRFVQCRTTAATCLSIGLGLLVIFRRAFGEIARIAACMASVVGPIGSGVVHGLISGFLKADGARSCWIMSRWADPLYVERQMFRRVSLRLQIISGTR